MKGDELEARQSRCNARGAKHVKPIWCGKTFRRRSGRSCFQRRGSSKVHARNGERGKRKNRRHEQYRIADSVVSSEKQDKSHKQRPGDCARLIQSIIESVYPTLS